MKLMVTSYDYGTGAYNAEVEETALRSYKMEHIFNNPAKCVITLADPTGALLIKYRPAYVIYCIADDGGSFTDETDEGFDLTDDDMTLLPAVPAVNDAYYFGFPDATVASMLVDLTTTGVWAGTTEWEYWDGDSWEPLTKTDGANSKWLWEVVNGDTTYAWTPAGDWASTTVNSITAFFIRCRVKTYTGITTQPLGGHVFPTVNNAYIGVGKITLEDPTATDIFYGRITRAIGNSAERTLTLECVDWMDQLDEEVITYDMREKLGTTDLRQSQGRADANGAFVDVAQNDAGTYYFYDDGEYGDDGGMAFVNDAYNGMYLIFTAGMAGKNTWRFFPYDATASAGTTYGDDPHVVWVDDDTVDAGFKAGDWTLDYDFRVYLGHNTPSDLYTHDSITGARLKLHYQLAVVAANTAQILIDDKTNGWIELKDVVEENLYRFETLHLNTLQYPDIVDANGIATVRFDTTHVGGNATFGIKYCALEVDVETTGYSSAVTINDTINPNKLEVATDLTAAATRVWEGIPYCIVQEIYKHLDPGTLLSGGDTVVAMNYTIESTSGLSTRQYKDKTRLDILKDLAQQDKSVFWYDSPTNTLIYKKTFGANTTTLTDADVDSWQSSFDYSTMFNKYDVYGVRLGTYEVAGTASDTPSVTQFRNTKSRVLRGTGSITDYSAAATATALAARDAEVQQMLGCTISGFDATRDLGTIVEITSSYLWESAPKDYIVHRWAYDSTAHKTYLTLHPKVSIGLQPIQTVHSKEEAILTTVKEKDQDMYVTDPVTHEVA